MLSSAANHHLPAFAAAGHLRTVTDLELQFHGDVALLRTGDVLVEVESPMEGIAEHYIDAQIALANVIVNPSLPLAA